MHILCSIFLIVVISFPVYGSNGSVTESNLKNEVEQTLPDGPSIEQLTSFQQVAATARIRGVPVVVLFCTFWCPQCDLMEQEVLRPMMLDRSFRERILLTKLEVDSDTIITGFDGRQYSSEEIAELYDINFYPTLVFFDPNGRELSQRIIGITLVEHAVDKLNKAINNAEQATKQEP